MTFKPLRHSVFVFLIVLLAKRQQGGGGHSSFAEAAASADEVVYVTSSYGQLVSSSTLRWRNAKAGDEDDEDNDDDESVVVRSGHRSALCRGWHQDQLSPGQTEEEGEEEEGHHRNKRCRVGFHGKTKRLKEYQVMVDPTSTSRLEWRPWDIFTKLPLGLVAFTGEDGFVARKKSNKSAGKGEEEKDEEDEFVFGDLNPRRGLSGNIALYGVGQRGSVEYATEGEILVEVQPVRYELREVEFLTRRAREEREEVYLGSRILTNELSSLDYERGREADVHHYSSVRSVLAYNATYRYYWGRMPGLAKALQSTGPTFRDGKPTSFRWALPLEFSLHRILELRAALVKGTSVQASAKASRVTTEVPYRARLRAHFGDGGTKERDIRGTYVETLLSDVEVSYGRPYFTRNGTFAPTTTTTTTPAPYYGRLEGERRREFEAPRTMNPLWPGGTSPTDPVPPTPPPALRPLRTTTPVPTSPNPLRRFYQRFGDEEGVQADQASSSSSSSVPRNSKRSPQTESLVNGGNSKNCPETTTVSLVLGILFAKKLSNW